MVLVLEAGFTARVMYEEITGPITPAIAQEDLYDCSDFDTQEQAQQVYNQNLATLTD